MRFFLLPVLTMLSAGLFAQEALFVPKVSAIVMNAVPLTVCAGNGLSLMTASLNGKACTLVFDTGASHTTFDRAFLAQAFPELTLDPVALGGETNVSKAPAVFKVGALTLGNTTLKDFFAMALPLGHLSKAVGVPVHGILGMNVMAYAPFVLSVGQGRVTWYPGTPDWPNAKVLPVVAETGKNTLRLMVRTERDGKAFPVLLDSGSSFTFLDAACWPVEEGADTVSLRATDINAVSASRPKRGRSGELWLGDFSFPIRPFVTTGQEALLGADALKSTELLIDGEARTVKALP